MSKYKHQTLTYKLVYNALIIKDNVNNILLGNIIIYNLKLVSYTSLISVDMISLINQVSHLMKWLKI